MVLLPIAMLMSIGGVFYSDDITWQYPVIWVFEIIALATRAGR
jgi:hypothetical protein